MSASMARDLQKDDQEGSTSGRPLVEFALGQEAAFNSGRAAHQLSLNHLASHHYLQMLREQQQREKQQQAVETASCEGLPYIGARTNSASNPMDVPLPGPLQHEAAHNLAMIYAASGSMDLARDIYRTFMLIV